MSQLKLKIKVIQSLICYFLMC